MTIDEQKFKRKCIICGKYFSKNEMIRLVRLKNSSEIIVYTNSNIYGHSFYICKDDECLNKSLKPGILSKYTKLNHVEKAINYISQILNDKKY